MATPSLAKSANFQPAVSGTADFITLSDNQERDGFLTRAPFIPHDFSLCDACYRISKQYSYLHIGGIEWRRQTLINFKNPGPVSCCVLGALIMSQRDALTGTDHIEMIKQIPVDFVSASIGVASKMSDILVFSESPILGTLYSSLREKWQLYGGGGSTGPALKPMPKFRPVDYKFGTPTPDEMAMEEEQLSRRAQEWTELRARERQEATLKAINDLSSMRDVRFSQIDVGLLQMWLNYCQFNHGPCISRPKQTDAIFNLILIDVKERKLVEVDKSERYFALSYVWGGVAQFKTTTQDIPRLKKFNSIRDIESRIPQVIKDAIQLVEALGERYLWADALCITHDDAQQKHQQISQMAYVYQQAVLTIVAMGGEDASTGLPGFQPNSRLNKGVEIAPGVRLSPRSRKLTDIMSRSVYNTRAWCYQERLLSRRCVFFTEEQMYFQCDTVVLCEDRVDPCPHDHIMVAPLASLTSDYTRRSYWELYARFVIDYSRKSMSFQADVIDAFVGIIKMIEIHRGWKFVAGLPLDRIDLALLWASSAASAQTNTNIRRLGFPSWAWAGWIQSVDFELKSASSIKRMLEALYLEDNICCCRIDDQLEDFPTNGTQTIPEAKVNRTWLQHYDESVKVLHCKAWTVSLQSLDIEEGNAHHYYIEGHIAQGMCYQKTIVIRSQEGHHCGTLFGIDVDDIQLVAGAELQFVLISAVLRHSRILRYANPDPELHQPGLRPDSSGRSGYYEGRVYNEVQYGTRAWSMLNILLVSVTEGSSTRLAVGQIHKTAWERAAPVQRRVRLV